jgi:hypothetical protein
VKVFTGGVISSQILTCHQALSSSTLFKGKEPKVREPFFFPPQNLELIVFKVFIFFLGCPPFFPIETEQHQYNFQVGQKVWSVLNDKFIQHFIIQFQLHH